MDSDFWWNGLPSGCLPARHNPDDRSEASGERQPPSASRRAFCCHVHPHSSPWPGQHLTLPPWVGKCSGRPVPKAEVPPIPHRADRPGKDPEKASSGQLEGPARPQTPPPSGLLHGCCKYHCAKMQPAQSHETKPRSQNWRGMRGPPLSECILLESEPPHCSPVGVTQTCSDEAPKDEASCDTFGFKLSEALAPFFPPN